MIYIIYYRYITLCIYTQWAMRLLPPQQSLNPFHSGLPRSTPRTQAANMAVPQLLDPRALCKFADPLGMCRPQRRASKEGELTLKEKGKE